MNQATLRRKVEQRDRGVCARCATDTAKLWARFDGMSDWSRWAALEGLGYRRGRALWEADHIVAKDRWTPELEARRGYGVNDLRNLQTLCAPCHIHKSAVEVGQAAKALRLQENTPGAAPGGERPPRAPEWPGSDELARKGRKRPNVPMMEG